MGPKRHRPARPNPPIRFTRSVAAKAAVKTDPAIFKDPTITSYQLAGSSSDYFNSLRLTVQQSIRPYIYKSFRITFNVVVFEFSTLIYIAVTDVNSNASLVSVHIPNSIPLSITTLELQRVITQRMQQTETYFHAVSNAHRFMHESCSGDSYYLSWFQTFRTAEKSSSLPFTPYYEPDSFANSRTPQTTQSYTLPTHTPSATLSLPLQPPPPPPPATTYPYMPTYPTTSTYSYTPPYCSQQPSYSSLTSLPAITLASRTQSTYNQAPPLSHTYAPSHAYSPAPSQHPELYPPSNEVTIPHTNADTTDSPQSPSADTRY